MMRSGYHELWLVEVSVAAPARARINAIAEAWRPLVVTMAATTRAFERSLAQTSKALADLGRSLERAGARRR